MGYLHVTLLFLNILNILGSLLVTYLCDIVRSWGKNVNGLFKSIENILHLLAITVRGVTPYLFFARIFGMLEISHSQLKRTTNAHETELVG